MAAADESGADGARAGAARIDSRDTLRPHSAVGNLLVELRQQRGQSRPEIAALSGISYALLANLETGRRRLSDKLAGQMATALDLDTDTLVRERDHLESGSAVLAAEPRVERRPDNLRAKPAGQVGLSGIATGIEDQPFAAKSPGSHKKSKTQKKEAKTHKKKAKPTAKKKTAKNSEMKRRSRAKNGPDNDLITTRAAGKVKDGGTGKGPKQPGGASPAAEIFESASTAAPLASLADDLLISGLHAVRVIRMAGRVGLGVLGSLMSPILDSVGAERVAALDDQDPLRDPDRFAEVADRLAVLTRDELTRVRRLVDALLRGAESQTNESETNDWRTNDQVADSAVPRGVGSVGRPAGGSPFRSLCQLALSGAGSIRILPDSVPRMARRLLGVLSGLR